MITPDLAVIKERDRIGPWLERLGNDGALGVDTETTGLDWRFDLVGGLCLAAGRTCLYACQNALGPAVLWLADQVKKERELVMHAAKFDMHNLQQTFNLRINYPVHHTKTLSFLANNLGVNGGHHLKDLAAHYIDPRAADPQAALLAAVKAAGGKKGEYLWANDLELIGTYGALDPWWTVQLFPLLMQKVADSEPAHEGAPTLTSLYENEQWLCLALRDMEQRGIKVNAEYLDDWRKTLETDIAVTEKELRKQSKQDILWTSTPQLVKLLYEDMGIEVKEWTAKDNPSTSEVALTKMDHPIGATMLKYRDLKKQHSTYAIGLLAAIGPDGRIHCTFNADGARTGRLSCKEPNLQQVPRESGARRAFLPDDGLDFYFGDYSQVEMRFAAVESNDPTLIEGFKHDPRFDTHAATAMKMWGMPSIDPDGNPLHKRRRKYAKIMNFAMLYGAGEDKVTSQLIAMLSPREARDSIRELKKKPRRALSPHRQLAQLLMQRYFEEFGAVKKARYSSQQQAVKDGFTTNLFGRRRYFDHHTEYKAFNTKIQGAAADQAKRGLVRMYREIQMRDGDIALQLQIHDEAVYLAEPDPKVHARVLECLNDTTTFIVPIVADLEWSSTSWQEKKKYIA